MVLVGIVGVGMVSVGMVGIGMVTCTLILVCTFCSKLAGWHSTNNYFDGVIGMYCIR